MHIELVVAKLITVGLGLMITYQAYRGYRTHGSEPMLYVAIGFLCISIGSVIEGILYEVGFLTIWQASAIQTGIVAVGMIVILYSLYGRLGQTATGTEEV